jgi:hypothetical protein
MRNSKKEQFSVVGEFHQSTRINKNGVEVPQKKFAFASPEFYFQECNKQPVGRKYSVIFTTDLPTRSDQQLRYHWILCDYLAKHCGYSKDEVHDVVMRQKFGTRKIKIGNVIQEVRKSISNNAKMSKSDVVFLIDYDLQLCQELEINIPSMAELGYLPK